MAYDMAYFADAAQTIAYQQTSTQMISGMTMAEAESALGAQVASNGMRLIGFESQLGTEAVTEFSAANAPNAYASFIESGGLTAESTAAMTGSSSVGAGTVALAEVGGQVATVGVATGSAGLVAAAAAPIFGAALGYGLYEIAPDFWTKISQALLPWFWEDTEALSLLIDPRGQTYINQGAINALQALLQPGSIIYEATSEIDSGLIQPIKFTNQTLTLNWRTTDSYGTDTIIPAADDVYYMLYLSTFGGADVIHIVPFSLARYNPAVTIFTDAYYLDGTHATSGSRTYRCNNTYTHNGKSLQIGTAGIIQGFRIPKLENYLPYNPFINSFVNRISANLDLNLSEWLCIYGNVERHEGILPMWEGNPYPENPNTINVLTGYDENDNPIYDTYQQVALPIGDPLVSNDPLIQPDPYYNPQPEVDPDTGAIVYPAIDPYISPITDPSQFPNTIEVPSKEERTAPLPSVEVVPETVTEALPSPEADPAVESETTPTNPNQPGQPTSGGNSVTPYLPVFPLFPTSSAGLYHVYNPTNAQLQAFGSWLWTTFSGSLIDTLSKLFNNPMDAVISLQEFYGTPNIQGSGTIRCGYLDSEIPSDLVGNRYGVIECGTVIIPEYYGNYLDYAPYSQVIVYLPFIGFMNLNADDIIGNAVNIRYHVDSYTGSCIAIITVARQGYSSVMYQFEGNCSVDVPVTGGQQSSIKGAIIGGISGAVMGGVAGAAVGAVMGGLSTKNDVQHSGSFSATYGAMGAKKPFIVVRRPVQKIVVNYNESYGFQAHKMVYVGNCRGYLRAREVRVLSTTATNAEKELIVNALKEGVYVKN